MLFFQNSAAEKTDALNQVHADWMMKEPELRGHDFSSSLLISGCEYVYIYNCKMKILNITLLKTVFFKAGI